MDQQDKMTRSARNRDHMANERTYLAWIRTAIGIMAFGFVVEKFSYFLKKIAFMMGTQSNAHLFSQEHYASGYGIALVIFGGLIGLFAQIKYRINAKEIEEFKYQPALILSSFLCLLVVASAIVLVIYLLRE